MSRKNLAFEEKGAAIGHNKPSEENKVKYTQSFLDIDAKITELRGEQKDLLNKAKDEGILKNAIRNAAKLLKITE